jgi:hypothetical protein
VVYFEHIRGFQKVSMCGFQPPKNMKGKSRRGKKEGKKSKGIWKRRLLKNFYHCSTILHSHLT